jgi:ribose/xylose/arabinose/galactoside ABC-type transport system permease subunit
MNNESRTRLIKKGAIWGFILFELVFFSIAGSYLSLSESAFMDLDNMLLLLKQSAPIGIIALGMTIIMINGNIDLSVGATYALAAIVMLDSMTWPVFAGFGDWVIPARGSWRLFTGVALGAVNGLIVWKTGVDAFIVTLGAMLGYRGLVFMYNGEEADVPPQLDACRFRRGAVSGPAHGNLVPSRSRAIVVSDEPHGSWPQRLCHWRQSRGGGQCGHSRRTAHDDQFHADRVSGGTLCCGVLFRKRLGQSQ